MEGVSATDLATASFFEKNRGEIKWKAQGTESGLKPGAQEEVVTPTLWALSHLQDLYSRTYKMARL